MSPIIESYLNELEAKVRRVVGKKKAIEVVAEMRGHLEESVAALVAGGASNEAAERESLAKLGDLDPSQLVPTDGAPSWFNRKVRSRVAFWYIALVSTLTFWIMVSDDPHTVSVTFGALFVTTFIVFAVLGSFGGRLVILPMLKAAVAIPIVNGLLASLLCLNVGAGYPFPRLVSTVASERISIEKTWDAAGQPTMEDVYAVDRLRYFYSMEPKSEAVMPAITRGSKGRFRYPGAAARNWSNESSDLRFVTEQWKANGQALHKNIDDAFQAHDYDVNYLTPALTQRRPSSPLPGFAFSGSIALMLSLWGLTFAIIGDIVRSTVIALGRLWGKQRLVS